MQKLYSLLPRGYERFRYLYEATARGGLTCFDVMSLQEMSSLWKSLCLGGAQARMLFLPLLCSRQKFTWYACT